LAVEAIARHRDAGMVDAVGLLDANDAKIGLHADIVRPVPPRDPVAAAEISAPVAEECISCEGVEKGRGVAGIGGFDKTADGVGRGHIFPPEQVTANLIPQAGFLLRHAPRPRPGLWPRSWLRLPPSCCSRATRLDCRSRRFGRLPPSVARNNRQTGR